jgi:hypothetical protein
MGGNAWSQRIGFGICFESIEGFGEVQRWVEELGVGCDVVCGWMFRFDLEALERWKGGEHATTHWLSLVVVVPAM